MILPRLFFYLFAGICMAAAFMVIAARNPVHSVLFLILAFVNAAGLFVLLGAEFLAMILIVVYVGAVAVLFLFVVMMLDVDFAELQAGLAAISADRRADRRHLPRRAAAGGRSPGRSAPDMPQAITAPIAVPRLSNTEALGLVLYTRYVYFFQAAGLILLVAMVGAIVLTLRHRVRVKRQNIAAAESRAPRRLPSRSSRCAPGRAWGATHDHRARPLSRRRRHPVHARRYSASSSTARTSSSS